MTMMIYLMKRLIRKNKKSPMITTRIITIGIFLVGFINQIQTLTKLKNALDDHVYNTYSVVYPHVKDILIFNINTENIQSEVNKKLRIQLLHKNVVLPSVLYKYLNSLS